MTTPMMPDPSFLAPARVHEITGTGRLAFTLGLIRQLNGAVIWIQDRRNSEMLYPPGLSVYFDMARLILVQPTGALSLLQMIEEALRNGAAPLVVADLPEAPDLTASRRLQLAAGTGGGRGLCLLPEGKLRSNASETRWLCQPIPGIDKAAQHWEIIKNKRGRLGQWQVHWTGNSFAKREREKAPA